MMTIQILIAILLTAIVVKALINGYRLIRLISLEKKYHAYMRIKSLESETPPKFLENIPEIIELLNQAGQKSKIISRMQNTGLGYLERLQGDLFENILTRDSEFYTEISTRFKYAIGTYKKRLYESFNPLYWIEFLIFLPANIVNYLFGEDQRTIPNWVIRLFNIIYWALGLLSSFFSILYHLK